MCKVRHYNGADFRSVAEGVGKEGRSRSHGEVRGLRVYPVLLFTYCAMMIVILVPLFSHAGVDEEAPVNNDVPGLSEMELAIWNDPAFKRRLVESYIAETEIEPGVTVKERERMQKVLELIAADRLEEASAVLVREIEWSDDASAVFDFTLANICFQQEKLEEAATCYRIAVEKHPKFRRAWRNLGIICVRQGEFQAAVTALTQVIEHGGHDAVSYGLLGFSYASLDEHLCAESAYRMAILLDGKTMDWKMGLARSLFKQERYAEAASLCGQLIRENPDRAEFWLLQANAYIGLGQTLKAAQNFELVDRLNQSSVDSLNMLGDIYINEELYDIAVDAYMRAVEKDTKMKPARAIRAAKVLAARGAFKETRRLIERVEEIFGGVIGAGETKDLLKLRARIAVAEGAGEEEARILEEIVELDPLDGEALILLGQHSSRNGDTEKAIFYFERAASIEKYEADANVRHAQLLVGARKYDEALRLLQRAQLVKPRENIQEYLEQVERVAKTR